MECARLSVRPVGMRLAALLVLASGVPLAGAADASIFASESFAYDAGANPGNGGFGWGQPWHHYAENVVVSPSLSYPGVPDSGNAMGHTGNGSHVRRAFASPITDVGTASVIFSVLIRPNADGTPLTGSVFFVDSEPNSLAMGDLPELDSMAGNWGLQATDAHYSSVPAMAGETALLVARVDFQPGEDRLRFWVNPTIDQSVGFEDALFGITASPAVEVERYYSSFNGLGFQDTSTTSSFDEIYVFTRPVPSLSTLPMVLLGLASMAVRRRRPR